VHKRIISAVERVEFVSDTMSCIIYEGKTYLNLEFGMKVYMKLVMIIELYSNHCYSQKYNVPTSQHPQIMLDISGWEHPQSD
jgi:hypothetical protein